MVRMDLVISNNHTGQEYSAVARGRSVESVKKKISYFINNAFQGKDYSGHVWLNLEKDGEWIDTDEGFFRVKGGKVEFE